MTQQFTPQDAFEFLQRMWNPLGVPIPGFPPASAGASAGMPPFPNPAAMMAALDPAEVEKKIAELRVVENWLTMTLSWIQMSVKTMELQKASLEALHAAASSAGAASAGASGGPGGAGGAPGSGPGERGGHEPPPDASGRRRAK